MLMKTIKLIVLITFCFLFKTFDAQTITTHTTIASLKVAYKSVPQSTASSMPGNNFEIKVIPQSTINLVTGVNVTKIYFKILNAQTQAVVYQVNYLINSPAILNTEGKKMFENNNGVIFISSGQTISLKPYTYQIQTEDNQSNLSATYSAIH